VIFIRADDSNIWQTACRLCIFYLDEAENVDVNGNFCESNHALQVDVGRGRDVSDSDKLDVLSFMQASLEQKG